MAGNLIRVGSSGPDAYERTTAALERARDEKQNAELAADKLLLVKDAMQDLGINIGGDLQDITSAYRYFSGVMIEDRGPNDLAERLKKFFEPSFLKGVDERIKTLAVATWLHRVSKENDSPNFRGYSEALQDKSSSASSIPQEAKQQLLDILGKLESSLPQNEPDNSSSQFRQLEFKFTY